MKTRVISAIVALIIFIPLFIIGGLAYNLAVYLLGILALKEFIEIKESGKKIPNFMRFIMYIIISFIIMYNTNNKELIYAIDLRIIAGLFLALLLPVIIYHDKDKYDVNDAFYLLGGLFFLGASFHLLILFRNIDIKLLIYLFLITIMTDTFAYITGRLIGKTKLLESVSPNKTWEGLVGGTVVGVFVSTMFFFFVVSPNIPIGAMIFITTFLSIIGQMGDLVFSAIKRYFNCKDFSNIMPGHGGVLDRLDSIIFVMLGYLFFLAII